MLIDNRKRRTEASLRQGGAVLTGRNARFGTNCALKMRQIRQMKEIGQIKAIFLIISFAKSHAILYNIIARRDVREVDGAALEMLC